ncbi:Hypp36 [Branchiostoma lanceolatum]|uniref:Hypp36 protein n=1 Tax=Branchiostoma lanceolatum TaxID=7740 RepID=A0A8J9YLP2_BRALA|nr:Hypp36 [Branchiostoma lanceolatum]
MEDPPNVPVAAPPCPISEVPATILLGLSAAIPLLGLMFILYPVFHQSGGRERQRSRESAGHPRQSQPQAESGPVQIAMSEAPTTELWERPCRSDGSAGPPAEPSSEKEQLTDVVCVPDVVPKTEDVVKE